MSELLVSQHSQFMVGHVHRSRRISIVRSRYQAMNDEEQPEKAQCVLQCFLKCVD
jgi:hypothetical protein